MILEDKYMTEIKKFCQFHNIPIKDGEIPPQYIPEIKRYIQERLVKERKITRELELAHIKYAVPNVLRQMLDGVIISPIEQHLWYALEERGMTENAEWQYDIGKYTVDIAYPKVRLVIECDGVEYHRANVDQMERDQKRDKYLAKKGWIILRAEGFAIRRDINGCIDKIKKTLKKLNHCT